MDKTDLIKHVTGQLIGEGNLSIIDSAFSADYTAHSGDRTHRGQKFIRQFTKQLRTTIPDVKIVKTEILMQSENILTWQRTLKGTHKAGLMGIPASDEKVKWYEIVVSRFDHDKITEEWVASDLAFQLMLKQKR